MQFSLIGRFGCGGEILPLIRMLFPASMRSQQRAAQFYLTFAHLIWEPS
ncbi:hypothetical protein Pla123a_12330 [Posidoniimonas polymericola]|uniref:Uncharacterized protein n=1 Tax=Posidoniimonas polymericola TaxID=2528002 RepID=A0A5C5YUD4_9BACT|nr:hypothetical protein Pla123a_12330 [Posidoniimonas polymericola]